MDYARESWFYGEVSVMSPANVPIFQFKTIIPIAGTLLLLQGAAQVCRCILCIKTGEWPTRLEDVEEMETMMQHQYVDEQEAREDIEGIIDEDPNGDSK
jgi:TRAP-type mannitol/chloroaromatic compound transport system permease small subunit